MDTASAAVSVVKVSAAESLMVMVVSSVTVTDVIVLVAEPLLVKTKSSVAVIDACKDAVVLDSVSVTSSADSTVEPTVPAPEKVPVMVP